MSARTSPTLNDLIELNHEIAALIRAGIPLELGLRSIAGDMQTSFDGLAERMALHLSGGRSLPEAFAHETSSISPVYAAVVDAGMRAGKLPEALESVARSARVIQGIRQRLGLALIYPFSCLVVAILLAAWVISITVPRWKPVLVDLRLPDDWSIRLMSLLYDTIPVWLVQIPLVLLGLVIAAYLLRSGPTGVAWRAMTSLNWLGGFGRVQYSLRRAQFLELLALQTSFGIPLEQAFPSSAAVIEEGRLRQDAARIASALQAGRSLREALADTVAIPASWKWILVTSQDSGQLAMAIRQLADTCRFQASREAAWFSTAVPTALALCLSAGIVLIYAIIILFPVIALWKGLGQP